MDDLTADNYTVFNAISSLAADLWTLSMNIDGKPNDPKMFSVMLFHRLFSNHKAYTLLANAECNLEASIVLRSGVETAICLAAIRNMGDDFVTLLLHDAVSTLQGQISSQRAAGFNEGIAESEMELRRLQSKLPKGVKSKRLDWACLAKNNGAHNLYVMYKMLSGQSSHVTGFSVFREVTNDAMDDVKSAMLHQENNLHTMMMAGITLQGARIHAAMIGASAIEHRSLALLAQMNDLSEITVASGREE